MSSRTAAARKRLQHPPPKVSPTERSVTPFTPTTRADLPSSSPHSPNPPRIHTSIQRLDLSNEFNQLPSTELPSPEYSPTYFPQSNHVSFRNIESNQAVEAVPSYGPFLHPQSNHINHRRTKWVGSDQKIRSVPTHEPSSPYEEDIYLSRRPLLRVDPHGTAFLLLSKYIT